MLIKSSTLRPYFLLTIFLISGYFAFIILQPYLITLLLGVIFSVVFFPIYKFFFKKFKYRKNISALVTLLFIFLCLVLPLILIFSRVLIEASEVYRKVLESGYNFDLKTITDSFTIFTGQYIPNSENYISSLSTNLNNYLTNTLEFLIRNIGSVFSKISDFIIHFLILLMALFYLFTNGKNLKEKIIAWSPLKYEENILLFDKIGSTINAVVRGTFGTMIIQGIVASIGFLIFGVPNAILWGSLCAFAAIIPTIGTYIVLVPAILYLFFTGESTSAIGLIFWALVAVNSIDNIVSPYLSSKGTGLNSLITLLSVFGGLALFGISGVILGPVLMSIFFTIFSIQINLVENNN